MRLKITLLVLLLGIGVLQAQQQCPSFSTVEALHTNHQYVNFTTNGTMFYDGMGNNSHHIPYQVNQTPMGTVFAASTWLSVRNATGDLAVMAPRYLSQEPGYNHGPLDVTTGMPIATNCQEFNHIWKVSRWAVERLITDYNDNGNIDNPVEPELLQWPGRGNPHFQAQMGYALPNQDMAPFYDQNADGLYNPLDGDYPVYKMGVASAIAEQVLWTVFHNNTDPAMATFDMQIEIQQTAYALDCGNNDILNKAFFIHQKVINKSSSTYQDIRYGNWNDFDLGCAGDDYVGSDANRNTVYAYNADFNDDNPCGTSNATPGYGQNPPVQAVTFLNQNMTGAIYHINSGSAPTGDPSSALGFERLLSGVFSNGVPMTKGGDGYDLTSTDTTKFMFPDNPNSTATGAWSMVTENLSGLDQRTVGTLHKATFAPGEIWDIDLTYSFHRANNGNAWTNVNLMEQQVDSLQQYYNNGLHNLSCPVVTNCTANCVFPGDANNNGIANDFDILEMGLAYAQTAAPRAQAGNRWFPYTPPSPIANAYVDADGLGQVDTFDLQANTQNWGLTHSLYTGVAEGSNAVGGDLFFVRKAQLPIFPNLPVLEPGIPFLLEAHLGDSSNLFTLQGITYRVNYDENVLEHFNRNTVMSTEKGGWIKDDGAGIYHRKTEENGLLHLVSSRLTNGDHTGAGSIEVLNFRVRQDVAVGIDTLYTQVCFEDYKAVQANGQVLPITSTCITIAYTDPTIAVTTLSGSTPKIAIYPNPAKESLQVNLGTAVAKRVELVDMLGQSVQQYWNKQGVLTIHRDHLPKGLYLLRVAFENGSQSTHKVVFQ